MNKIYKIVWNALLGIWVVASELAKGKTKAVSPSRRNVSKSIDNPVSNGKFRPRALALYISLASTGLLISPAGFAATLTAGTQAELSNAVNNAVDGDIIQLTGDITINTNITLSTLNKNVVIDGQGQYGLTVTATTTNGFTINGGTGNFTLQNMTKIDSANYYGMVTVNGSNTAVNVIYDNIDYLGSTQIIFMGANGGSTNSIMTFGNILNDVVVNDRGQEIGEVNNVAYTGRFHVTHTGNAYSFRNSSATNNTATMYFGPNSDVLINRTDGTLTATGTSAWQYTFADGAKFELISAQDVLSGTNNNRGIKIGTYDATTGFGAGASIILEKTNTGSILSGNAIDNATTNTTGYNIGATGSDDVIFNLGKDTSLATSAIGVSATKSSGSAGIYIRNAGKIAATTGISATQNGSGNTIVTNEGNINATTGVNATQNGSGTLQVNNAGTITSTTSGITVNSTATDKNITVNNTGGTINATGGSGVNVLNNAVLNLIGGVITTTNAANAVTISNTAAHNLSDLTINLNGTGNAISKSSSTNVTLANTTLNINDRIGFNDLSGLNFASSSKGNNTINVGGTGTGISTTNTALAGLNADALDINVTGAGVGIATTGGGLNLVNQGVNINVTNSGGTALTIADGSSNSTVIGKNVTINAKNATAIEFSGTAAKNFTNQGSVIGNVDFAGDAGHSITNSGILDGNLTAKGSGNNTLVLNNGSESRGSIELGNGANNVTINNGASLTSITTGSGDDVFTLNDMQGTDTYLGMINAGDGDNTLDINRSQSSLYADTSLQGFNNINLSDTTDLTLVDENNISSGNIVIDDTSKLQFGSAFQGDFSATLGHVTSGNGDGNVNVNNGANVKLTNTAANTFDGTWDITQGGTLTATNNGQLASNSGIELGGILNLEGLDSLNNVLTGNGTLNIDANNGAFNFGTNTGAGFSGITNLGNSQFTLSGNNTTALTQSKLSVNSGAAVTVTDKNQAIGGLVLNGGTTVFDNGSIATDALSVTNTSTVKVNPEGTQQDNLLDQNAGVSQQLVSSSSSLSADDLKKLTLQDLAGDTLGEGTNLEINQGSNDVATGTYNYELSGTGGLSIVAQLIKVALAADQSLTLDTKESSAKTFTAQITGSGNLALNASGETLTLNNADNDYTGTTTINSGTAVAGSNNALGATSGLTTLAGSGFNLSGKNQTINGALTNAGTVTVGENGTLTSSSLNNSGTVALAKGAITNNGALTNTGSVNIAGGTLTSGALTNSGTVNLGGGTLTLSNGGASTSEGGLAGSGSLLVSGGTLTVSKANSGLTANTSISDGAGITLTDTGSLGSGTVNVGGDLNLNSTQTLANVLSGGGTVNTGGVITLSGNNTGFTGSQNIGTDGQLTVSSGANLGADTVGVNLKAAGAELVLNGVKETLNHILSGVINTVVSVKGGSATILAADNTDFFGNYAVSGSSSLQIGNTSNLGSNASVSLAAASDILRLTGFSGVFANSVSGLGQLVLYKSNATLNNTQKLDSSVGVNIGSDSTLTLASQAAFNHALTGSGTLSIDADNQDFAFGANTGSAFSGQVNFDNGQLALSGSTSNNSTALTGAVLSVDKGATVDVTGGDQSLGGLTLNGGTTVFNNGTINTKKLQVAANGVVQVDPLLTQTGKNLLDQNVQVSQQLVHGSTDLSAADIDKLTLTDLLGKELGDGSEQAITEGNNNVATGTYNYGLSGSGGLSTVARLVKVALTAGQVMTLNTSGSIEKVFTALITGSGNLALNASGETLTLNNAGNDYTGTTTINSGTVVAGSNNALGATSGLTTLAGSRFNLSGKTQTINGALTNAGTVNLGGGTLALNNGGTSSSVGGLAGNGSLQVTGGELTVSKANSGLTASTTISKGAAVTLTDTGSLGTGAVSVGGDLNLDAAQTLANVLSGDGAVNTGSAVTLSGSNTAFTGSQNIGTGGQLSVSSGVNLGTANKVNLTASGAELVLNAVSETLNQVLTGVAGTTVSVKGAGATVLGANNTGFAGNYAVSGSSSLQVSNASNLGTGASVSLAAATDLLRLAGYSGVFANQVSGAGQLVLDDKAGVTLNGTQKVADSIGVDIGTDSNLTLSSLTAFNHALTGDGTLNISTGNQTFAFGTNTGSGYKGTVNLGDSQFALAGNNTTALTQANLSVNKGAKVSVTGGEQAIGGLVLNGGTTLFNEGVIKTGKLSVTGTDASIIQVEPGQTLTGDNLLDQNVKSTQTLVDSDVVLTADELANLTLQGSQGQALDTGTEQAIIQNSVNVGTGTYNYTLSGEGGGLSTVAQLVKVALAAGKMLALDTTDSVARTFTAQITGSGDLALNAHSDTLTLNSADNDYTGGTTINSGTVVAGSNNALGATSSLSTVKDTQFNLNGKNQTINGTLTNAGTVSLGGGTLTLNNGGTSTSEGGLTGSGTLQVNGGNLILSEANNDLAGSTIIGTDGAVTLNDSGDLGSAAVTVGGNLNLNADQSLANVLSGVGSINTTGQVTLSGDNGQFTGTHNLNGSGSLTVSKASSLGGNSAKVAINSNKAALILNALTGTLNSVLSGVADSQVQVTNKSAVTLNASNTNFLGQYAISGGSSMQIGDAANLGSKASVSLATAADILALAGLNGALANTVTGLGQLVLNSGSKATLSGNNIADTVGVDIDTDSNLILSSLTAFNHALTGGGILSIDAGNQAFTFGANTGSGYKGTVDLANSQFALSGNNTTALTQASLAVSQGAKVNVTDGAQAIGGLALNGGTTTFNDGSITTDNLSVSGDATSIIQVQPGQTQTGSNLLDQNVGSRQQLVNSTVQLTDKDLEQLVLQDSKGQVLGDDTELAIDQGGIDVATGTYNYGLSGVGGGLSTVARLIKVALAADHILTLDTKESSAKTFTAQITGSGNLALNASGETLTLNNAGNDYTGGTTINSGTVVAGSNNALGATSGLTTLAGSGFNLNGKNQTINGALTNAGTVTVGENGTLTSSSLNNSGTVALAKGAITNNGALTNTGSVNIAGGSLTSGALTNSGTVNLGGGTLALNNGGTSSAVGGLAGNGSLQVTGGELTVSKANSGLTASTTISKGAAVTLTDTGSLGTGAVSVGGDLNLDAAQTLANVLSGDGAVNTGSAVTLSGSNTAFTGSQNIGTGGQLSVSSGANLGTANTVNLTASGAELVLNAVKETLNQVLTGVAGTTVSVKGAGATVLGANNTGFAGNYAVSGSSSLQASNASNLGTGASVSLATATDLLRLAGYSGIFANTVNGAGQLVLNNGATVALNSANVADTVGVNISTNSILSLSSLDAFNHALTGGGTLSIDADDQAFTFGANTGSAFGGQVNFGNGQLALSGSTSNNSTALSGATLSVDKDATVNVTGGDQSLGGLTLNGGTTVFNNGTINTKKLQVAANGIVQVDPLQTQTDKNLLDQNVQVSQQLVHGSTDLSADDVAKLTLTDLLGNVLGDGSEQAITEGNNNVATGTYNYGLSGSGGLSTVARLVKVALTAGEMLTLDTAGSNAKIFTALITGSGNLGLSASGETLTLNNAGNDYTGTTTINSGTVVAGSNNALGATSGLSTLAGSGFNLNGKTQAINGALTNAGTVTVGENGTLTSSSLNNSGTVALAKGAITNNGALTNTGGVNIAGGSLTSGALTNSGTVNLGGGTLALNNGGTSSSVGGLAGNGSLQVTGGELTVSKANSGLTASTTISKGAAVTLTDTGSLGTGAVSVGGDLNLDAAQTLANVLSGDGAVNTGSAVTLSGSNTAFTGSQNIGTGGQLSVSSGANLGTANTVNLTASGAELVLNAVKETLNQVLTGVAGTTVSVKGAGATVLGANNTGFAGNYAVSGSSSLQVSNASNLGTGASVSLAAATDLLRLAGYSGIFANTVNGAGQLVLNNGATVALNSANVADTVGVNIGTDSSLSLSSLAAFNHALTGGGTLSIDADNQAFTFGANTGSGFGGLVNFGNGQLALSGSTSNNSTALTSAILSVDKGATVDVTGGDQSLGGLTLNGGTTTFDDGTITTAKLSVADDATSIIQVEPGQTQADDNLLDQNVGSRHQLVNSTVQLTDKDLGQLTLQDSKGQTLAGNTELAINQDGIDVATGTYNYGLSGIGGGLSTVAKLVKVALTAGQALALDTAGSTSKLFTAQITGRGNLELNANTETLTLDNADNDYTGGTIINSGTVVAGSDNALGATSSLSTLANSRFNLNGKNQTINGALTNAGTVTVGLNGTLTSNSLTNNGAVLLNQGSLINNGALANIGNVNLVGGSLTSGELNNSGIINLGSGTLTLNNGGVSTSVGGLAGNGSLRVTGGELTLSKVNSGLTASTAISEGAAVTLTDTGSLGSGAVSVGGDLNLNATQTLANVLSGDGAVNTGSAVTLSGSNTAFTGSQNIGANGQLTVSSGANLGAGNAVNLTASGAELVLNAVNETLNQVLTGIVGSTVSVKGAGATVLGANNTGFAGNYAVSGSSSLQVSNASNLGTSASVSLAAATDILKLAGYSGIFANQVSGAGQLELNNSSVILNSSQKLANSVGVDIDTNSNLTLSSLTAFNQALTGDGVLNIDAGNQTFAFGANTGSAFDGKVNLNNSQFALSGSNTTNTVALKNAMLSVNKGADVSVTAEGQAIGGLTFNGGTTAFNNGSITTNNLNVTSDSIIQIEPDQARTGNLLDQNVQSREQLVNSTTQLTEQQLQQLTLQNAQGDVLNEGVELAIHQNNADVAQGTYNYLLSGLGGGLSTVSQLVKVALIAGKTLTLDTAGSTTKTFTAQIVGDGNLALNGNSDTLTLTNAQNSYSGTTTINSGIVAAGSDNALGQTASLSTKAGSQFNLNGKTQNISGALTNAGTVTLGQGGNLTSDTLVNSDTVNIDGGTFTLNNGGSSTQEGGLTGNGTLQINGGDLELSKANAGLAGETLIGKDATITLSNTGTLGSASVDVGGNLNLNLNNGQVIGNILSGAGTINTAGTVTLGGTNTFSGTHSIGKNAQLTISKAANLGADSATVDLSDSGAELVLNGLTEALNNNLSGVTDSTISLENAASVKLGGSNSGFNGTYALSGKSTLIASDSDKLGTAASVSLGSQDTLSLEGYNGTFANQVTGQGTVSLSQASGVTLDQSQNLGTGIGVKIEDGSDLNLSGLETFDHALTGYGALNIDANNKDFTFGSTTGSAFFGQVTLNNTLFDLPTNSSALTNAGLTVSSGSIVNVGTSDSAINGLNISKGRVNFSVDRPQTTADGVIKTQNLTLDSGTVGINGSSEWENYSDPSLYSLSVLEQDYGNILMMLVDTQELTGKVNKNLKLNINGEYVETNKQAVFESITQGGQVVADATYNFGLADKGASGTPGLYAKYSLVALNLLTDSEDGLLLQTSAGSSDLRIMRSLLSGVGGLVIDASNGALTIENSDNSYTGDTLVKQGDLILGDDGVLGKTSLLDISAGASTQLNGHSQTIGSLQNSGSLDITGGTLNVTTGGTSSSENGLTGDGTLQVNGGTLTVSNSNAGLLGNTLIEKGAAVALTGLGNLGSAAIDVGGELKLSVSQALANILSGDGEINTDGDVELTGKNTFTGTHNLLGSGTLTIGAANNLGDDSAKVSLNKGTALILSALNGTVNNAITGVAGSTVSLVSAAQATLGGDNSHFEGTYNVSGNSTLSVGTTDQLGADASVLLADTGDTLNLNDFGETFSNSVQGTGTLSLTQGSSATLDASQQLGANIGINISDDSALNLSGLSQFNQALKGEGTLNVNANDQAFSFGDTTGNAFLGDVALSNSQFDLSGNNTTALTKATLSVGDDATVSVTTGTQKIGGLVFNGGITQFTGGDIAATSLDVSKDSVIQVENDLSLGTNLLEQSYGETRTLVASQSLSADKLSMLRLQNLQNEDLNGAVEQDVVQGGQVVGQGFYNYGLSGDNGLSVVARLITLALAEGQKLQLDTANTQEDALTFTAQITGKGNLQLDAASNNLTLANENNDYTGSTTINTGTVVAGSNNALGKTSSLNTLATTGFNLNGYTQTISGALNNAGSVNIAGGNLTSGILTNTGTVDIGDGTLTLTNGGRSDIQDGLTGSGTLNVNAGTLTLSSANAGLSASTLINQGAAITLVDDGTLGNAAVTVDGSLNLNAKQTLGNVLSGIGQVNTAADITLSGNNADFSGTHSVAANGQLTVSQAVNLGSDKATVDLSASGAELVLSGVKEAVNQALNGGAGTLVSVTDESATILGGDNSGFLGQYAVSGGSSVQVSKTSALGDKASVSLEGGNAILSLSGFDGVFANTVSGEGQLMLNNGASVTLNNTNVAETVGVDISADNDLTLANLTAFNHSLSGSGDLNINSDNQAFNFGANTGDSFGGNVTLNNTIFNLNTNNVAALNSAKLTLDSGSQVNVGNTDNVLNKLDIKDGTLAFEADAPQSKANGTVTVNDLNLAGGVISVTGNSNWENTTPVVAPGVSILEQDAGNVLMTLIDAKNVSGNVNDLTLSINGTKVTEAEQAILSTITQGGVDAAQATYNYGLTDANNGQGGLYVKYGLTALKLLTDGADALVLATAGGSTNQTLNALLSGTGGLNIDASKGDLTLANGNNSYTGETTVNAGNLLLGANGALGQTSALNIAKEASTSLNGFKQTVGQLNNGGKLDLAGGELALNQGGYSTETDGLKGNGTLTINGGDFAVSGTNASLSGKTVIQDTASVTLTDAGTLGSSNIDISSNGALNLNVADLNLGNTLSGAGKVNINAATILSGNSDFTGEHHVGENASLTVSDGSNIGAKDATVHLDNATSSLVLKALSGAVNNALYGVADSIVALTNGAKAQLNGDNSGFLGRYTVNGNSALIVTAANNLGNASGVELTNAGDKLVLSGYQGDFTHSVTGNGELNFTDAADVIFNSDYNVDNTIGMNIDTNSSLTLDGLDVFNHQLDGSGVLNINNGGNDFHFGNNTGKAFTGNVNLNNTGFTLTADNDLLQNAYLTLSKESLVTVSNGEQKVAGLSMNGGTLKFDNIVDNNGQFTSQGTVTAGTIDVTGGGNVQVALPTNVTPGLDGEGKSLLELDAGNIILQLAQGNANGSGSELVLQDENGEKITAGITADLTNQGATSAAAKGTFDYGLSTGDKLDGLYINYGLKAIELLASGADALKVQALADKVNSLSSLISGTGDLAIEGLSDDAILTLTNGKNDYTGATLVNRGGLKLSADGALGDTSELAMAEGTSVDINNTTQTAGKLNSAINTVLNLNGGTLTVKDGGQIAGTLLGAGQFNLQGGQLAISQANTGFTGNTSIDSAASATLNNVAGLGSGSIANKGTLTLDGAEGNFANNLTENGKLQLQNKAAITLTGNNSQYSGAFITDEGTSITASKADQVGTSSVNNNGTFIFNVTDDWSFNNVLNGSGELVKQGAGTLKFTGDSVTASNTVIENGLVQLGEGTTKSLDEVTIGQQTVKAAADTSTQTPFNLNSNVTIQQQGALGGFGNVTGNVDNAGRLVMSHALTGDRFADFTINGNYTGQAGSSIIFDTVLAGDDSATDRLVIKGDSSGVGTVYVNNISGQGAYTNNGIKIIDISGKSGANFELGGRVVAGAYEYKLYQGGTGSTGGTGDGNWYLRTENPDRPEAGSYIANLAAANTLFNTNLEDRSGETWYTDAMTGEKKATSMWLRTSGSHNRSRDDNSNFKTQDNRFVTQLGGDILRFNRDANDLWRLGVMAGYGQSNNNTHTSQSGSESKGSVKGYSIGTYGTWFADTETNTGAYVDTWLQYSWFKNEVNGQDLATEKYDSKGFTGSLEGGYTFQTGASENYDFYVQPKAQAIWMGVKADGHKEASNTQISGTGNGNVQTRIGLKAFVTKSAQEKETQSQLFKPYAELSWVHNSKDFGVEMSHETTGSQTIKQGGAKNVAEVKLGLEGDVTNRLNMWGNVTQQVGGKGYSETSVTFGVKYNF